MCVCRLVFSLCVGECKQALLSFARGKVVVHHRLVLPGHGRVGDNDLGSTMRGRVATRAEGHQLRLEGYGCGAVDPLAYQSGRVRVCLMNGVPITWGHKVSENDFQVLPNGFELNISILCAIMRKSWKC